MKKLMYLLPVAALAMASCSNSEDVAQSVQSPVENQELKFFPAIQGNTRGAIETTASISQFYLKATGNLKTAAVGGADYAVAWQSVTKDGTAWTPTTKIYWALDKEVNPTTPTPATGNFTAFANATKNDDGDLHDGTDITTTLDIVIPTDLSKQKDFVVAYNSGLRTAFSAGVPLHFRHALSQIVVNATYANDADATLLEDNPELDIKVKSVKFANVASKNTLTLPSASTASGQSYEPAWGNASVYADFAATPASIIGLSSTAQFIDGSAANNPLLLMPQTTAATTNLNPTSPATVEGAYLMVEVDINEKESGDDVYPKEEDTYAWIAVPVAIDWKAGYKYTYTLNFSNIAAGYIAPGNKSHSSAEGAKDGDPVLGDIRKPVNFLVTVEEEWTDGGTFTPDL